MSIKTDSVPSDAGGSAASLLSQRKPRFALFIATACGLGYLPKAPGTWGSLAGLLLAMLPGLAFEVSGVFISDFRILGREVDPFLFLHCLLGLIIAAIGVWCASRAAKYWHEKDPQRVVVDEVSGQYLTLILACALPLLGRHADLSSVQGGLSPMMDSLLNWKYLLLGFILFRAFDIWKPFPARQAESLPGGWGIMADDWVAGVYAALGLWITRMLGL
jgi:phosphatidylglycerophosphatase A